MPTIDDLFNPQTAKASGFAQHEPGLVAYVTNGFRDNGVLGFVKPKAGDRIFDRLSVVLSAFCEATVQIPPFVARGNGGSGLIVLEPKTALTAAQLGYIAAYINTTLKWRFSWSRQASVERVRRLEVPKVEDNPPVSFAVRDFLPPMTAQNPPAWTPNFEAFLLDDLFSLSPGDYHNASDLAAGDIPLISCGDCDNGIAAFVTVPADKVYQHKLTIAFNGMNTLTTKFHPYAFAAKDDVAICTARKPLRVSTLVFVQLMMNRERWRYSYYRKCFMDKLKRQSVQLPAKAGVIDEDLVETLLGATTYWTALKPRLAA